MLGVAGLIAGLAVLPASPWGMPTPTAAAQPVAAAGETHPGVLGVRIGIHPDKTRFVVEVSDRIPFHLVEGQGSERLVIELPDVVWPGGETPKPGHGIIRSYHAERTPAGMLRLVLITSEPARLGSAFVMPPSEGYKPRLVFDLLPSGPAAAAKSGERLREAAPPPSPSADLVQVPPPAGPGRVASLPPSLQPNAAAASPPVPLVTSASARPGVPPSLAPPAPGSKPRKPVPAVKVMVALDPGHGGVDPGATGINGIHEKDITLATAFEVRRQLEASGRFRVMMTREDDEFVPLRERVARARQAGADLFISLHADSIAKAEIRGLSIYTQSDKGSDHEAETLAAKENRADAIGGIDLSHENDKMVASILIDLAQRDTRNHSHRFATMVLHDVGRVLPLLPKPDRSAAFAVLTAPDVPSVLIEMGYLSNINDATLLTQAEHRHRLAVILERAVEGYFTWRATGRRP